MSSVGAATATVVRRPTVRLAITGNELLPAGSRPSGFHITDSNGPMLAALAERDGAVVHFPGLVRDDADDILAALQADADVVIVSGGSSVGIEDLAPMLLASHGELAVHGIAMRPSSPTGLGRLGHRLVFLLPGNPVSALCAYDFFAGRAIRALGGRTTAWPYRSLRATLARKISSPIGRLDYARVKIVTASRRAAGRRRRVDALLDDEGRRLCHRRRRTARASRPAPTSTSGSMREQEQFLQVLDRDEAERRFRARHRPDAARHRAHPARRRTGPGAGRRRAGAGRRPVLRSLERRRLCRCRRRHVRCVGRSAATSSGSPTKWSTPASCLRHDRAAGARSIDRHRRHDAARRRCRGDGRTRARRRCATCASAAP